MPSVGLWGQIRGTLLHTCTCRPALLRPGQWGLLGRPSVQPHPLPAPWALATCLTLPCGWLFFPLLQQQIKKHPSPRPSAPTSTCSRKGEVKPAGGGGAPPTKRHPEPQCTHSRNHPTPGRWRRPQATPAPRSKRGCWWKKAQGKAAGKARSVAIGSECSRPAPFHPQGQERPQRGGGWCHRGLGISQAAGCLPGPSSHASPVCPCSQAALGELGSPTCWRMPAQGKEGWIRTQGRKTRPAQLGRRPGQGQEGRRRG